MQEEGRADPRRARPDGQCQRPRRLARSIPAFGQQVVGRVAAWAAQEEKVDYRIARTYRQLDRNTLEPMISYRAEWLWQRMGAPWDFAPPDQLVRKRFALRYYDGSVQFLVPGPDIFLEDAFIASHCFHVRTADPPVPGLNGAHRLGNRTVDAIGFVGDLAGNPLPNARVVVRWADCRRVRKTETRTTSAGLFTVCALPPDTEIEIEATRSGFVPWFEWGRTRAGHLFTAELLLRPAPR